MLYENELSRHLQVFGDQNNNKQRLDKYSLRPRSSRRRLLSEESTNNEETSLNIPQTKKPKSAPLSKYRRKTANARERHRMKEINQAFEALRKAVPQMSQHSTTNEKLTKITTLRLAMKYINTLSAVLNGENQEVLSDCSSELDCIFLESDGLTSDFSDHSLTHCDFSSEFHDDSMSKIVDFSPFEHLAHFDTFLGDFS